MFYQRLEHEQRGRHILRRVKGQLLLVKMLSTSVETSRRLRTPQWLRTSAQLDETLGHGPTMDDEDSTFFGVDTLEQVGDLRRDFLWL